MKYEWEISTEKIGVYDCVKHKVTGEVALVCMFGEIWPYSTKGQYRAVIYNHRCANRLFKILGLNRRIKLGDEALLSFTEADLSVVIKAMKAIADPTIARHRANNFNHSSINSLIISPSPNSVLCGELKGGPTDDSE